MSPASRQLKKEEDDEATKPEKDISKARHMRVEGTRKGNGAVELQDTLGATELEQVMSN